MRATRLHGGHDQYCIGRKANSSRPERRKLSRLDSNFYSIRAFALSTKSAVDYDECRNCEAGELMLSARSTVLEPVTQGLEIPCSFRLSYERFSPVFSPVGYCNTLRPCRKPPIVPRPRLNSFTDISSRDDITFAHSDKAAKSGRLSARPITQ